MVASGERKKVISKIGGKGKLKEAQRKAMMENAKRRLDAKSTKEKPNNQSS